MAFINCIVQIFFTDFFLGYEFTTFGTDVLNYVGEEGEDRPDPFKHPQGINKAPRGIDSRGITVGVFAKKNMQFGKEG